MKRLSILAVGLVVTGITILASADRICAAPQEDLSPQAVSLVGVASISGETLDLSGLHQQLLPEVDTDFDEFKPKTKFTNDMLGGISAIAWAGEGDLYWCLSDRGPLDGAVAWDCRVQQIRITLVNGEDNQPPKIATKLVRTVLLRDQRGIPFTGLASAFCATHDRTSRLDPEGIRVAANGNLIISDEYGPRIIEFTSDGQMVREFVMPRHLLVERLSVSWTTENLANSMGRPCNRGMEGLAVSADGKHLYGLMQSPLLQDSNRKRPEKPTGVNCRLPVFSSAGTFCSEYLYQLENRSNKLNEILACGDDRFITIERDGRGGANAKFKKLMLISTSKASDIHGLERLSEQEIAPGIEAVQKRVFIDLLDPEWKLAGEQMPEKIEGLAFGPNFPNGDRLLLIASDNDFVSTNPTQIYLFRVSATAFENSPRLSRAVSALH